MAVTLSLSITSVGPNQSDSAINCVAAVTNSGSAVSISQLQVTEQTQSGAQISQPIFLTPNTAPGTAGPTIGTSATGYFPFQVVVPMLNTPGPSPNTPNSLVQTDIVGNSQVILSAYVVASDGSTATAQLLFPVRSAVAPFPVPVGGTFQHNAGGDAVNWFSFNA